MKSSITATVVTALRITMTCLSGLLKIRKSIVSSKNLSPRKSSKEKKTESWPSMPECQQRSWRPESARK